MTSPFRTRSTSPHGLSPLPRIRLQMFHRLGDERAVGSHCPAERKTATRKTRLASVQNLSERALPGQTPVGHDCGRLPPSPFQYSLSSSYKGISRRASASTIQGMYRSKIVIVVENAPVFGEKAKTPTAAPCFYAMNLFRWVQQDLEVKPGEDGQKEL